MFEGCADRTWQIRRFRMLGTGARKWAQTRDQPPHFTVNVNKEQHINGVGLVYFASIHEMIVRAERNIVPELVDKWPVRDRRVHYYANTDIGDTLEFSSLASVKAYSPSGSVLVQTFAKRGSDQRVIACAEAIYGELF